MRGSITGKSRIMVLPPSAANTITLLIDGEIMVAAFLQADSGKHPCHSRTNDDEAQTL